MNLAFKWLWRLATAFGLVKMSLYLYDEPQAFSEVPWVFIIGYAIMLFILLASGHMQLFVYKDRIEIKRTFLFDLRHKITSHKFADMTDLVLTSHRNLRTGTRSVIHIRLGVVRLKSIQRKCSETT